MLWGKQKKPAPNISEISEESIVLTFKMYSPYFPKV